MRGRKNTTLAGSIGNASAWFQVVLIPRHGAYLMTMRARQLERIAPDRRPTLTSGAHPVARAPVVRQVDRIGGDGGRRSSGTAGRTRFSTDVAAPGPARS